MRAEVELFAHRTSPLHRWDARWKIVSLAALTGACVSLQQVSVAALGAVFAVGLLMFGRLPTRVLMTRLAAAQVLLLPCLLVLPFTFRADPWQLGPVTVSGEGFRVAALLYLRALAALALAMAVVYSTPMVTLLRALQTLRLPRLLVEISLLTYRYLFSLWWELTRMRWALATRGFGAPAAQARIRPLASVIGVSLVRSVERTERIHQAMRCRGFAGRLHTLQRFATRPADWIKACACAVVIVGLLWLDRGGTS
ncbi:MAG: cobalt ECF transporter T component CbiQ [Verrucomicrobia bacterium]|nr:cobalt ECF transporter T component CbiQ [Verrucomicrobiota bacterium]